MEEAYNFQHFMPMERAPKPPAKALKVVGPTAAAKAKSARARQVRKTLRFLALALLILLPLCGVVYNHVGIAEAQSQIDEKRKELSEAQSYHTYLTFELEGMTNQRGMEQRATELGLVPVNNNQITYVKVNEDSDIEVKASVFTSLWQKARTGFLDIAAQLSQ